MGKYQTRKSIHIQTKGEIVAPIIQYKYTNSKTFPFPWTEPTGHLPSGLPPLPTWPSLIKPTSDAQSPFLLMEAVLSMGEISSV